MCSRADLGLVLTRALRGIPTVGHRLPIEHDQPSWTQQMTKIARDQVLDGREGSPVSFILLPESGQVEPGLGCWVEVAVSRGGEHLHVMPLLSDDIAELSSMVGCGLLDLGREEQDEEGKKMRMIRGESIEVTHDQQPVMAGDLLEHPEWSEQPGQASCRPQKLMKASTRDSHSYLLSCIYHISSLAS